MMDTVEFDHLELNSEGSGRGRYPSSSSGVPDERVHEYRLGAVGVDLTSRVSRLEFSCNLSNRTTTDCDCGPADFILVFPWLPME